ncbi:MAG: hydrogenase maturation protease [Ilumatobacteraceae bacterium]
MLIAGVGNVLRGDDGFGVEVARRLDTVGLPPGVKVIETGIAGIALVQELQEGWDALLVVDAVDRARPPGTILVLAPEVVDVEALGWGERHDLLADMHLATPERALMLARALGVLPPVVRLIGCQPLDAERVGIGLAPIVADAVEVAVCQVLAEVDRLTCHPAGA